MNKQKLSIVRTDRVDLDIYNIIDFKGIVGDFFVFTTDDDVMHGLKIAYIVEFELSPFQGDTASDLYCQTLPITHGV